MGFLQNLLSRFRSPSVRFGTTRPGSRRFHDRTKYSLDQVSPVSPESIPSGQSLMTLTCLCSRTSSTAHCRCICKSWENEFGAEDWEKTSKSSEVCPSAGSRKTASRLVLGDNCVDLIISGLS